jgi:hypothetical protein
MDTMATEAHISRTSTREYHRGLSEVAGACAETVDMAVPPSFNSIAPTERRHIGAGPQMRG